MNPFLTTQVYPCPNLESLHIEKPTNDIFNIDAQNVPFLYGNTVPFVNLKVSRNDYSNAIARNDHQMLND